jgi:hypothetical protein
MADSTQQQRAAWRRPAINAARSNRSVRLPWLLLPPPQ